ncbi:MAG: hypothetical protein HY841_12260 [Bacteroidetes bacterium]|nr:hypothetical protein [Bacteroidota bacterium]
MILPNKYLSAFLFIFFSLNCFSQETLFSPTDTMPSYHIVTLKDGTVLKGKILNQGKRTIQFQDEMLGSITFRAKEVVSMEKVEPQDYYLITLMNGTTLQGKIVNRKEKEIVVETASIGDVAVDLSKIKTIKSINPGNMKDGKYWFKTHVDAHYVVTPSAIPLSPGEAYYQNTMGLYNSFDVGITKNFSCIGGVIIPTAMFISPRLSAKITKGVYVECGFILADITYKPYGAAGYAQCTFGNRNGHLSVGGAYGFVDGIQKYYYYNKIEKIELGFISVSGMKRIAPKYAVVTENWFTPTEGISAFTGGFRIMGEKNTFDFGIARISVTRKIAGNPISIGPLTFLSYMRNL